MKPSPGIWDGFVDNQPLVLTTGDIIEFGFDTDDQIDPGLVRDYIIRAVGKYEPGQAMSSQQIPNQYQLYDNYPNPFNPVTKISYDLPKAGHTQLAIFNVLGQCVATLVDAYLEAGHYQIIWDANDDNGTRVASGIYFYRLTNGSFSNSKKMVLLK